MTDIRRRQVLQGLGVGAVMALAGCTREPDAPGSTPVSPSASSTAFPNRPGDSLEIDAVVFDGAFGTQYVRDAADALQAIYPDVTTTVTAASAVATELADRFLDGGTPPDLLDNSGADSLPIASMTDEFQDLTDFLATTDAAGTALRDTLMQNALSPGLVGQKQLSIDYVLSVHGLWYSASRFAAEGWAIPTTWDAMLELGEEAHKQNTALFVYSAATANYFQDLAITSAIKEGGHPVRVALDNLAPDAWLHPAMLGVLQQLETCVTSGFVLDGGDEQLSAQAQWSKDNKALLYPSGGWIAREMAEQTAADFEMSVAPVPTLTSSPTLPAAAIHLTPTESFAVPSRAANPAGGKELLRILLTPEVAANFTRTNLVPTVVRNSVPEDLASTALTSQTRLIADAGDNTFTWRFPTYYGLSIAHNAAWRRFLAGELSARQLAERLQKLSDQVAKDPDIQRYTVS